MRIARTTRTVSFTFYKTIRKAMVNMKGLLTQSKQFLKRNAPTILTSLGAIGVAATAVTAVMATPKAMQLIERAEEEKGEKLTKLETVKVAGPVYIPSVLTGVATITCIFGADAMNKRRQAALLSAYALLDNSYKEYKAKVKDIYGDEADEKVKASIAQDYYEGRYIQPEGEKKLFFDSFSMRYFESTIEDVQRAEYKINRDFEMKDAVSINEFYEYLGLEPVENGDRYGWSTDACFEMYGNSWIDFDHHLTTLDDGLECYILSMPFEPVYNFDNYYC